MRYAFVFPGQGSQSVGMLDAWGDHPAVKQALEEASDALGQDMGQLIAMGSKEELALTVNTQPVMLIAGVAAYRAWLYEGGAAPHLLAGHSLGEYSALVAAGVMSLTQAAPLVRLRAQAMQEAVAPGAGAMAAILGMDSAKVIEICRDVSNTLSAESATSAEVVEAVNFNDPGQTVIAGSKTAVEMACVQLKEQGAKRVLPLPVSAPFHSSLMKPAADKLAQKLVEVEFSTPSIAVLNNVDVRIESNVAAIRDALYRQAYQPVRWVECIRAMREQGIDAVVECGPGKVLLGMTKRIEPELLSMAIYDPDTLREARAALSV